MSVKTRASSRTPRLTSRATSQILGKSPKRLRRQDITGRKAKIRLRVKTNRQIRRKHGCREQQVNAELSCDNRSCGFSVNEASQHPR
jgi:hypothetical protein